MVWPGLDLDPNVYAIIGMSALSASVIGGPLTMSFIALESTGNLWLTTAVLVAVIISTQITRELFGYSFATWRLHLRGETIRSAADVGWIRDLTVRRLMRPDRDHRECRHGDRGIPQQISARVEDAGGRGRCRRAAMSGWRWWPKRTRPISRRPNGLIGILHHRDVVLHPAMNIQEAIAVFDAAEAESLAVVEAGGERRPIGILTEAHAMRRYAEESDNGGGRRSARFEAAESGWLRRSRPLTLYAEIFSSFCRQRVTLTSGGIGVSGKLVFQSVTPTSPT